jgi:hypothetical protein
MSKCVILRGLWGFLENNIPDSACDRFGEDCVFLEKMTFSIISRGVFFEDFGDIYFVKVWRGHFLESYAVFLGNICRSGFGARLKTGAAC